MYISEMTLYYSHTPRKWPGMFISIKVVLFCSDYFQWRQVWPNCLAFLTKGFNTKKKEFAVVLLFARQ